MIVRLKESLPVSSPMQLIYRVNSGHIPTSTWLHDAGEGGGMLVGEMCHFIDLMQFLAGARPVKVYGSAMRLRSNEIADNDNLAITVSFDDGSVGTLNYNTVGSKSAPKERLEVFVGGAVAMLDDFRTLTTYIGGKRRQVRSANQDKGQRLMLQSTVTSFLSKGEAPIPFLELADVMHVVFGARTSVLTGEAVDLLGPTTG
jgi:polar amino acid transport system substrate-binding protein